MTYSEGFLERHLDSLNLDCSATLWAAQQAARKEPDRSTHSSRASPQAKPSPRKHTPRTRTSSCLRNSASSRCVRCPRVERVRSSGWKHSAWPRRSSRTLVPSLVCLVLSPLSVVDLDPHDLGLHVERLRKRAVGQGVQPID